MVRFGKLLALTIMLASLATGAGRADDDSANSTSASSSSSASSTSPSDSGGTSDSGGDSKPLQGQVNAAGAGDSRGQELINSMPTPVLPKKAKTLQGGVQQAGEGSGLSAGASDEDADLKGGNARTDGRNKPLQGGASDNQLAQEDPDADDQELSVEWDAWRNRFLTAVQTGVQEQLNNPDDAMLRWDPDRNMVMMRFPMGTVAWFYCRVDNQRHIVAYKLEKSSGFPNYDRAVEAAVRNLEGTGILRYPKRSKRLTVVQIAGIKTAESAQQQYYHFGDTERIRVPAQ